MRPKGYASRHLLRIFRRFFGRLFPEPAHRPGARRRRARAFFVRALASLALALRPAPAPGQGVEEDFQKLRERLTEREDENRVEEPYTVDVFGHPLSLNGQWESALDRIDRLALGDTDRRDGRLLLEQQIEGEAFYSLGETLSFFGQVRLLHEEDLDADTPGGVSSLFLERGEMWLFANGVAGLPLQLELGRLDFEDDRLWWWDEDLDAIRLIWEAEDFEVAVAAARELAPSRSDLGRIAPEHEGVTRLIAEVSWDWSPDHAMQFFALRQKDQSGTHASGEILDVGREDESDADLTWLGVRLTGAVDLEDRGIIGYWADLGGVRGGERLVESEEAAPGRLEVGDVIERRVRGWAFDAGATWLLPFAAEPRVTVAFARGSGDRDADDGIDRGFHQTGLHANEPGFGGMQRFQGYGEMLDPELSNLSVFTVGLGWSILRSSSVDLAYHDYRMVEAADSLRDARVETGLTGEHRHLGRGIDVVVALEEWETIEFEFSAGAFRAGEAFGAARGTWVLGGYAAFRYAF